MNSIKAKLDKKTGLNQIPDKEKNKHKLLFKKKHRPRGVEEIDFIHNDKSEPVQVWWQLPGVENYNKIILDPGDTLPVKEKDIPLKKYHTICCTYIELEKKLCSNLRWHTAEELRSLLARSNRTEPYIAHPTLTAEHVCMETRILDKELRLDESQEALYTVSDVIGHSTL